MRVGQCSWNPWWSIETFGMPILSPGGQNDRKWHQQSWPLQMMLKSISEQAHVLFILTVSLTAAMLLHFFSVILVVYCLVCSPHVLWFCLSFFSFFLSFIFCLFRFNCEFPSLFWLICIFSRTRKWCLAAACPEIPFPLLPILSNQPPLPLTRHAVVEPYPTESYSSWHHFWSCLPFVFVCKLNAND